jgi:hypothetical protein
MVSVDNLASDHMPCAFFIRSNPALERPNACKHFQTRRKECGLLLLIRVRHSHLQLPVLVHLEFMNFPISLFPYAETVSTSTFGSGADLPPRSVALALGFLV